MYKINCLDSWNIKIHYCLRHIIRLNKEIKNIVVQTMLISVEIKSETIIYLNTVVMYIYIYILYKHNSINKIADIKNSYNNNAIKSRSR